MAAGGGNARSPSADTGSNSGNGRSLPWLLGQKVAVPERVSGYLDRAELVELWVEWAERFPLLSIEDGMGEDDWAGWRDLTAALGDRVQLVGDDLLVTSTERLERAV